MEQIKEVKKTIAVRCPFCSRVKEIGYVMSWGLEDTLSIHNLPHSECPEMSEEEVFLEG